MDHINHNIVIVHVYTIGGTAIYDKIGKVFSGSTTIKNSII